MTSNIVAKDFIRGESNVVQKEKTEKNRLLSLWVGIKKEWRSIIIVSIATAMVWIIDNPLYNMFYSSAVGTVGYLFLLRKAKPLIGEQRWSIAIFQTLLFWLVANPVIAQDVVTNNDQACSARGLFAGVTNFVNTVFSTITFGGVGGGTLSNLICQVIGFMIVALLLAFIGTIGRTAYQLGYEQQPLSAVINPVFGFLIFAGGVTVVTTVMLGTGTT